MSDVLSAAKAYAARGWRVFPVEYGGKRPLVSWTEVATNDPASIADLFASANVNIAITTGAKSGLTVIDVDDTAAWGAYLEGCSEIELEALETYTVATPSGGMHLYFQYDSNAPTTTNKPIKGVDIRSEGGYVVAPPSKGKEDSCYTLANDTEVKPFPRFLLEPRRAKKSSVAHSGKASLTVEAAKKLLDNIDNGDYDTWYKVGIALGRSLNRSEEGWQLYVEWSDKDWDGKRDAARERIMRGAYWEAPAKEATGLDAKFLRKMGALSKRAAAAVAFGPHMFCYLASENCFVNLVDGGKWQRAGVDNAFGKGIADAIIEANTVHYLVSSPVIPSGYVAGYSVIDGDVLPLEGAAVANIFSPINVPLGDGAATRWYSGGAMGLALALERGGGFNPDGTYNCSGALPPRKELEAAAYPLIKHLKSIMQDDPRDADLFLDYMAYKYQHPDIKPRWALLIAGGQGVGKDAAVDACWLGYANSAIANISAKELLTPYNDYLKCALLRVSEVADLGESNKWQFNEMMKVVIAGHPDKMLVNVKYGVKFWHTLTNGTVLTTNHLTTGLYIPSDDRRYYVINCERGDTDFNQLFKWLSAGGYKAVGRYLMYGRDVSNFNPAIAPVNSAAKDEVQANSNPVDETFDDALLAIAENYTSYGCRSSAPPPPLFAIASSGYPVWVHARALPENVLPRNLSTQLRRAGYTRINCGRDPRWFYTEDGTKKRATIWYYNPSGSLAASRAAREQLASMQGLISVWVKHTSVW